MKITQITASYGATQSLPEYSNVKPALTLTAELEPGEDPKTAWLQLWEQARQAVHEQIDLALEANGRAAKYDPVPRFQVMRTYWNEWEHRGKEKPPQYVVLLPDRITLNPAAYDQKLVHTGYGSESRRLRYTHALAVAQEAIQNNDDNPTLLDCSSGDLTALNLALSAPEREPDDEPRDFVVESVARVEQRPVEDSPEEH